jgi:hypothetical protein
MAKEAPPIVRSGASCQSCQRRELRPEPTSLRRSRQNEGRRHTKRARRKIVAERLAVGAELRTNARRLITWRNRGAGHRHGNDRLDAGWAEAGAPERTISHSHCPEWCMLAAQHRKGRDAPRHRWTSDRVGRRSRSPYVTA